jgi:Uma2 family endonuclease
MAGASERHDLAAGLLYEAVAPGARAAGCRPFTANRLVKTRAGSMYYPDVMVACGKAPDRMYETSPTFIVEVLSPSTATIDRREKALAYTAIESLRMLLLVDPEYRRIEAAWLDDSGGLVWDVFGPGDVVVTGYGDLDVERFYDELDATATTN